MNLEKFIEETLRQVAAGVKAAQGHVGKIGGEVNPELRGKSSVMLDNCGRRIDDVEFDVALTVTESSEVGGGLSVIGIGAKGGVNESTSSVSRIKFKILMSLPITVS